MLDLRVGNWRAVQAKVDFVAAMAFVFDRMQDTAHYPSQKRKTKRSAEYTHVLY